MLAARILQGIGGGAADTVAPALIGDVYVMDQRGRAMALYTVCLTLGPLVGGIAGGYIGHQLSWAYLFWVGTALSGACFLGIALFVPKSLYTTPIRLHTPASSNQPGGPLAAQVLEFEKPRSPLTYLGSLSLTRSHGSLVRALFQPWTTLIFPGTWLVMLHYAGLVGGVVTISMAGAQLVAEPPYLWGPHAGLINLGGLVGAGLGYLCTHLLSDAWLGRSFRRGEHRDRAFAEPEDRLPAMFLPLGVATASFFVFGFCAQNPREKTWVGLEVGFAMLAFSLVQVPSIGFNYLIDAYSPLAADCFVMVTILRSIVAFARTFFVSVWIEARRVAEPFGIFGMLMGLFSLSVVPLWMFGKRMRMATARHLG